MEKNVFLAAIFLAHCKHIAAVKLQKLEKQTIIVYNNYYKLDDTSRQNISSSFSQVHGFESWNELKQTLLYWWGNAH